MDLATALAHRTLELVDIPSVSGGEAEIMRYVAEAVPLRRLWADDDVLLVARETPEVLLAGHLDTVPAQDNLPGRLEGGAVVGLGASDMKGGLAVMIELARWAAGAQLELEPGFLFFTREELSAEESPLPAFLDTCADARAAELGIVLEPTDNTIQVGCLGNLVARVTFRGTSAHAARPWTGDNAIHKAVRALLAIAETEPNDVVIDGLVFREVVSVVGIASGIAANVVPATATCEVNYRYAPGRSREEAEASLRALVGEDAEVEILGNSAPAPVVADRPLVRRLRDAGGFDVAPKQAWTPVAQLAAAGIDAVNLGPGATGYAHRRDERVESSELARTFTALQRFLGGSV